MDDEFARLGREHATIVLFKVIFVLLHQSTGWRTKDLRAYALQSLDLMTLPRIDESSVMVGAAARDFVERVFGVDASEASSPGSGSTRRAPRRPARRGKR